MKWRLKTLICHLPFLLYPPFAPLSLQFSIFYSSLSERDLSAIMWLTGSDETAKMWQPYLQHSPANCQPLIQQSVPADQCKAVLISFLLGKKWTSLPAATMLPVLFPSQTKGLNIRIQLDELTWHPFLLTWFLLYYGCCILFWNARKNNTIDYNNFSSSFMYINVLQVCSLALPDPHHLISQELFKAVFIITIKFHYWRNFSYLCPTARRNNILLHFFSPNAVLVGSFKKLHLFTSSKKKNPPKS